MRRLVTLSLLQQQSTGANAWAYRLEAVEAQRFSNESDLSEDSDVTLKESCLHHS